MGIVIVSGLIGSGKDETARHIVKKHGFTLIDHSDILGNVLNDQGRSRTREEKIKLRMEHGNTFTAEIIADRIKKLGLKNVVIGSSRHPEEVAFITQAFPESKLLVVHTDQEIRFKRIMKRDRDNPKDWNDFIEKDAKEERVFNFTETFSAADAVINNNSSLQNLYKEIDKLMKTWE